MCSGATAFPDLPSAAYTTAWMISLPSCNASLPSIPCAHATKYSRPPAFTAVTDAGAMAAGSLPPESSSVPGGVQGALVHNTLPVVARRTCMYISAWSATMYATVPETGATATGAVSAPFRTQGSSWSQPRPAS